jgi:hypothetical protein
MRLLLLSKKRYYSTVVENSIDDDWKFCVSYGTFALLGDFRRGVDKID